MAEQPFLGHRMGELLHLYVVERFFENDETVGLIEPGAHLVPRVVRVGGTNHDLEVGAYLPETGGGFDTIPAGGHADVQKGHCERATLGEGLLDQCQRLLALESGNQFKVCRCSWPGSFLE